MKYDKDLTVFSPEGFCRWPVWQTIVLPALLVISSSTMAAGAEGCFSATNKTAVASAIR
ncbi:MAG: hypothetical protein ACP5I8_15810 [Phycisphaerae bacterium]